MRDYVWSVDPNPVVREYVGQPTPDRALDLGAGEGRNAVWLAAQGWRVTAVDFSAVGLEKAGRLADSLGVTIKTVPADVRVFEIAGAAWDLVLLSFPHVPTADQGPLVARAGRGVVASGALLLIAHDRRNLTDGWGGPQDPDLPYTVEGVVAHLGDLVPEVAGVNRREVATDSGPRVTLDTVVFARRPAPAPGAGAGRKRTGGTLRAALVS